MAARSEKLPQFAMPWWASPIGINLGFLLPMLLLIVAVDQINFEGLTIRGIRFLTAPYIVLGAGLLIITALGGWLGGQIKIERRSRNHLELAAFELAALALGCIAVCAYLYWFKFFLLHPAVLLHTLTGAYIPDRKTIGQTAGLTSLVNFAPVFFSIYAYFRLVLRTKLRRSMHGMLVVLLGFTVFRVYVWGERVALIEAALPFALAGASRLHDSSKWSFRLVTRLGPYVALPFLILYFGIAESVRSWTSTTYHQKLGFWQFVIGRLTSYYYTSLNNGAGVLATTNWPTYKFEVTLAWLHKTPIVGHMFSAIVNLRYFALGRFLSSYGDEEFNNPSGLYGVIYDLGLPLGVIYFAVAGFMAGLLFSAYRGSRSAGILLYPMSFVFFMEIFRYPYFGATRAFTWLLGICLALAITKFRSQDLPDARGIQRDSHKKLDWVSVS